MLSEASLGLLPRRRNVRRPGIPRFRLELSGPARDRRDSYEHAATGTLNLPARMRLVTCQMLAAMRTFKLELAHTLQFATNMPLK